MNDSYVSISRLQHGSEYEQTFFVDSIVHNSKMLSGGRPFARVTLRDTTGTIDGVIWEYEGNLEEQAFANMRIAVHIYRGAVEFQTHGDKVATTDDPINRYDYISGVTDNMLVACAGELQDRLASIDDPIYRDIMGNALDRLEIMSALMNSPYGIKGPMAYPGGLLVHVTHALRIATAVCEQARELDIPFNPSLVTVGCVLRNIGWHTTTRFQGQTLRPRDAYYSIGVHRASARYIDHLMLSTESDLQITVPESKRQALENMCNKRPDIMTLEGKIVSCSDNMADVLEFSVASLQHKQNGNWRDGLFVGHINGKVLE